MYLFTNIPIGPNCCVLVSPTALHIQLLIHVNIININPIVFDLCGIIMFFIVQTLAFSDVRAFLWNSYEALGNSEGDMSRLVSGICLICTSLVQ